MFDMLGDDLLIECLCLLGIWHEYLLIISRVSKKWNKLVYHLNATHTKTKTSSSKTDPFLTYRKRLWYERTSYADTDADTNVVSIYTCI